MLEAEPRAALDQLGGLCRVGLLALARQRIGQELDDEQQVLPGEVGDHRVEDGEVGLVRRRHVGAQVDHDLAAGAAELAHAAGGDALDHVGDAVALRREVRTRRRRGRSAAPSCGRSSPSSTRCGTAQNGSTSTQHAWLARYRVMSALVSPSMALVIAFCAAGSAVSSLPHAAALVAGDDHHRAVGGRRSAGSRAARPWSSASSPVLPAARPPPPRRLPRPGRVRVNVLRRRSCSILLKGISSCRPRPPPTRPRPARCCTASRRCTTRGR